VPGCGSSGKTRTRFNSPAGARISASPMARQPVRATWLRCCFGIVLCRWPRPCLPPVCGARAWCRRRGSDPYPAGGRPVPIRSPGAAGTRLWAARAAPIPARVFGWPPGGCGRGCASGGGRDASARDFGGGGSGTRQPGGRRPNAPSLCDDCPPRRPPLSGCRTGLVPSCGTRKAAAKRRLQMKNPARGRPAGSVAPVPCTL